MTKDQPKILFKYLSIDTVKQLCYRLDTINNNRIYFSKYDKFNDPLEGSGYSIQLSGYCGMGMSIATDTELQPLNNCRSKFRILCLTETCFSPSMWAHYANTYKGICIGYWTKGCFSEAKKVEYVNKQETINTSMISDFEGLETEVYNSFFYKHTDWEYEKEHRIVRKMDNDFEDYYLDYEPDDVACIIFGYDLDENICSLISSNLPEHVRTYRAHIGYCSFGINLLDSKEKPMCSGSEPKYIRNIPDLISDLSHSVKELVSCT